MKKHRCKWCKGEKESSVAICPKCHRFNNDIKCLKSLQELSTIKKNGLTEQQDRQDEIDFFNDNNPYMNIDN